MALKFKEAPESTARPDDRGRITLGSSLTSGVSRYDVFVDEESGEVLLRPYKEIPANEAWLYENPTAHKLVIAGLESAKAGKTTKIDLNDSSWIDDIKDEE
jgi:hypothetical protein